MAGEKYGPTASGLTAALVALGSTLDEVAKTLQDGGYRGERGFGSKCPVASYLGDVTGREAMVCHDRVDILVGRTKAGDLDWLSVNTPPAVDEFVTAFDSYDAWPELAVES